MMDLQEWALNRFSPVVMVMATPNAEAMCEAKNGLSVTDMLRPYGTVHNISVPVRTVGDQSIRINGFKLRLHEASTIFQPSVEAAEAHLSQVLSSAAQEHRALECMQSMEDIRSAVASGRDLTPWFTSYRDELFRLLSFSDFETFDHPVACLFVCDANTDELPSAFQQLDRPEAYPWLMKHGVMEPKLLKHYILLCDSSTGSEERAKTLMSSSLAPVYGANNVHVLKINSGTGSPADSGGVADIWRSCQLPSVPGGGAGEPETRLGSSAGAATADAEDIDLGLNLTASDLEGIALFMRDFTMRSLLPFLEGRIRALNLQINATRKGLKNSLKALWWRKERSEVPDSDKSPATAAGMYNYATVESQMRCLSDLSFMVRDYGLASSTLRLLQGDYKADKALRHYAGAQEMLALSLMMSGEGGSGTRELEDCLMQAYGAYSQCGGGYLRYATRSMLHLTEIHKRAERFREAKASLMKAHFEEVHVRAALLLEQTAVCLLKSEPPLERKFAFHLVLAGLRFHQCDQRLLAERAYSQVLAVYNGRNWSLIEEHLNDVLGRYSQDKGDIQTTVKHTMALLGSCMHRNESVQEHYMRQFCEAVKESERRLKAAGKEAELPLRLELPLPAVAADSAVVHVDGVRYKGNAAAYEVEDAVWDRMHEALCTGGAAAALGNSASSNWLAGRSVGEALVSNVCCVNEEVGVDIEFSNPLSITLQVTDIRLLCELDASTTSTQDPSNAAAQLAFTVRPQDLVLRSKEKSKLGLMVTPLVPGLLRVLGVEWCLNGAVNGRRLFQQRTKPRWKGDTSHQRLMFSVITPMPRLAATVHGLPSVLYAGELTRWFLELRNCGDVPMKGLRIAVSHPGEVLCSSRPISSRAEATTCLDEAWQEEADLPGTWLSPEEGRGPETAQLMPLAPLPSGEKPSMFYSAATRVWRLPKDTVLEEGGEAFWPLWICPARTGTHAFELAIYFEKSGGGSEGVMKHRVLCIGQTMSVVPSLQVQASMMGDATQLRRHLLQLSVHNFPQANESFRIRQISCISPGVELQKLPGSEGSESEEGGHGYAMDIPAEAEVAAGDTSSLFLHIEKRGSEGATTAGPGVLPVRSGPLQWFNACANDAAARGASGALRGGVRSSVAAALGSVLMGLQVQELEEVRAKVVVVWEVGTQGRTRRLGIALAERLEGPSDLQQPHLPLQAALKGPHIVTHNFASSPLCVVPLSLSVANSLPYATAVSVDCGAPWMAFGTPTAPGTWHHAEDTAVTSSAAAAAASSSSSAVALAQSSSDGGTPSRQCSLTPSGRWQWCGQSHSTLGPLQPGAAAEARLQVVAFAPGHFQVRGYRLAYSDADLLSPDGTLEGPSCTVTVVHKPSSSGDGAAAAPAPTPAASFPDADQTHEPRAAIVAPGIDAGAFVDESEQDVAIPVLVDDQAAGAEEAEEDNGMVGEGEEDETTSAAEDDTVADVSCRDDADMELMAEGLDTL